MARLLDRYPFLTLTNHQAISFQAKLNISYHNLFSHAHQPCNLPSFYVFPYSRSTFDHKPLFLPMPFSRPKLDTELRTNLGLMNEMLDSITRDAGTPPPEFSEVFF
jgi:hypothetical protein